MENTSTRSSGNGRRHSTSREQLLRMVEAQSVPVSTAALTRATGLHENTVRGHLEQLRADGHLTRERAPAAGRGRPAWLWRALERGPASPYAALAGVLAETLARTSDDPPSDGREAGRVWGREIGEDLPEAEDAATARDAVVTVMDEQGFSPHDTDDAIVLRRCPLIEAAARHPEVVCSVHRGLVDGVLASIGRRDEVDLVPFSAPGECALHVRATS